MAYKMNVAEYLHSWKIDNFTVDDDHIRIGNRHWRAVECRCGLVDCDGWEMVPLDQWQPTTPLTDDVIVSTETAQISLPLTVRAMGPARGEVQ